MELVRWNPHRGLFGLNDRFGSIFDGLFYPPSRPEDGETRWAWNPIVDIYEDEGSYVVTAEIPGVDRKDIEIDIKDRILSLRGERSSDDRVDEGHYYRRERHHGKFERTFTLPAHVDPDKIDASFKDGVLKIEIPKPEERKPKQITVH